MLRHSVLRPRVAFYTDTRRPVMVEVACRRLGDVLHGLIMPVLLHDDAAATVGGQRRYGQRRMAAAAVGGQRHMRRVQRRIWRVCVVPTHLGARSAAAPG